MMSCALQTSVPNHAHERGTCTNQAQEHDQNLQSCSSNAQAAHSCQTDTQNAPSRNSQHVSATQIGIAQQKLCTQQDEQDLNWHKQTLSHVPASTFALQMHPTVDIVNFEKLDIEHVTEPNELLTGNAMDMFFLALAREKHGNLQNVCFQKNFPKDAQSKMSQF
jgi:hypothetical protein